MLDATCYREIIIFYVFLHKELKPIVYTFKTELNTLRTRGDKLVMLC